MPVSMRPFSASEMLGLKLVAASDSKGGIYNEKGLDPKKVVDYKLRTGSLQGFPGSEPISNEDLLELNVTVLFPVGPRECDHG